ncbi:MAG: hypothetical protein V7647_2920 [Acidobacteriota bacterium]|jgi:hypothetical protein
MHRRTADTFHRRLALAAALALTECGQTPITSARIERAIAPTFANLVHAQLTRIGLPGLAASDITVTASCRKLVAETGARGAGEWVCTLAWHGPNRETLHDTYDLTVGTDGCYTATVEGAEANLGGPTIVGPDGSRMTNLLYTFDGCFDTT